MLSEIQERAMQNLADGLRLSAKLPHRVLAPQYVDTYVTEFDVLLRQNVVELFKALMRSEGSATVLVAAFNPADESKRWYDDYVFVTAATNADMYGSFLKRNVVEFGQGRATPEMRPPWLIFAERIGACSESGAWCVYGEKCAEIALLSFKERPSALLERRLYLDFQVERLAEALKRPTFFGDPRSDYSRKQRAILQEAYVA
jgi:hypothetical protein